MKSAKKEGPASSKGTTSTIKRLKGFTEEERAAMRDAIAEHKAAVTGDGTAEGDNAVLAKIGTMPEPDRSIGRRLHAIIRATAPTLVPRLWYGMPAYSKDGQVLCFFQHAAKFKARYGTLGFSDEANLDEGSMWPTSFALKELTAKEEARVAALVRQAAS